MQKPSISSVDKLIYIQKMLFDLRKMAQKDNYAMLSYFIEMAYIETVDLIKIQSTTD